MAPPLSLAEIMDAYERDALRYERENAPPSPTQMVNQFLDQHLSAIGAPPTNKYYGMDEAMRMVPRQQEQLMPGGTRVDDKDILSTTAKQQFLDADGDPLAGGLLYTYLTGTDTPSAVYSDSAGTPHTNPVVLDAGGWATIYLGAINYKFVLKTSAGVTVWTVDPVSGIVSADTNITGTAGETLVAGDAVYLSDGSGGNTAGRWYKTDSDQAYSSSDAYRVGFATEAIASGATGSIMISGRITGIGPGLTPGTVYYASATALSTAP